jgi:uncharacterized protein
MYDIIIGRNEKERTELGLKGTVFLGKHYVKMGQYTSLSNNVYLDVNKSHTVLIAGKKGSGKSYTGSVIAEGISKLDEDVKENLSVIIFDTLGVFWTMKYPNTRDEKLLEQWNLKPEGVDVKIFAPVGYYEVAKKAGIPVDKAFSIRTSELDASDWCNVFNVRLTDSIGVLIERVISDLKDVGYDFSIKDIIEKIKDYMKTDEGVRNAAENRFLAADKWGLFSTYGTKIDELILPGEISVIDISAYTNVSGNQQIKALVIGLISRKLLRERVIARKLEEIENIESEDSFFFEEEKKKKPMVWMIIDEGHEFIDKKGEAASAEALIQLIREGRQPGISMILITQQPGEIHNDVITQSDVVISHRVTAKVDIDALNAMMQSYLVSDIEDFLNNLPSEPGAAIILDDNSERIYPVRIRPKSSWHGGSAPSAVKVKKRLEI